MDETNTDDVIIIEKFLIPGAVVTSLNFTEDGEENKKTFGGRTLVVTSKTTETSSSTVTSSSTYNSTSFRESLFLYSVLATFLGFFPVFSGSFVKDQWSIHERALFYARKPVDTRELSLGWGKVSEVYLLLYEATDFEKKF